MEALCFSGNDAAAEASLPADNSAAQRNERTLDEDNIGPSHSVLESTKTREANGRTPIPEKEINDTDVLRMANSSDDVVVEDVSCQPCTSLPPEPPCLDNVPAVGKVQRFDTILNMPIPNPANLTWPFVDGEPSNRKRLGLKRKAPVQSSNQQEIVIEIGSQVPTTPSVVSSKKRVGCSTVAAVARRVTVAPVLSPTKKSSPAVSIASASKKAAACKDDTPFEWPSITWIWLGDSITMRSNGTGYTGAHNMNEGNGVLDKIGTNDNANPETEYENEEPRLNHTHPC